MGGGHRGAGDGVLEISVLILLWFFIIYSGSGQTHGAATDPGAQDVGAGGLDVDDTAIVGVAGLTVAAVGGANGADGSLRGRRVVGRVGVVVAGGDGEKDTGINKGGGGLVNGGRVATTKGHVGNDTLGAAALGGIGGNEVDASDDTGGAAGAVGAENLDGVELGLLSDTIGGGADGAGNVGAVAVTVGVGAVDKVGGEGGTAAKVLTRDYHHMHTI